MKMLFDWLAAMCALAHHGSGTNLLPRSCRTLRRVHSQSRSCLPWQIIEKPCGERPDQIVWQRCSAADRHYSRD
jgi:hypothetical protein